MADTQQGVSIHLEMSEYLGQIRSLFQSKRSSAKQTVCLENISPLVIHSSLEMCLCFRIVFGITAFDPLIVNDAIYCAWRDQSKDGDNCGD